MNKTEKAQLALLRERMESGALIDQPCWSFIKELNSYSAERLDSVALRDGYRAYTYRQMFRYWEKYAEAFSGIGLTGENHSRVALIGPPQTETIIAYYALNMTGASISNIYHIDLYDEKQIYTMIEREKITDLVVAELYAFPLLMKRLFRDKELLGLRNIVLLPSPMGGDYGLPPLETMRSLNKQQFSELPDALVLEDLLEEYEAYPIAYGDGKSATILHTAGTVSGMHKPVPMSDRAMNAFVVSALKAKESLEDFKKAPKHMVTILAMYINWVYAMVDMLHTPLGMGMEVVTLPWGATNPRYAEAIEDYGVNILFTSMTMLDSWIKSMPDIDLSKVKLVFMGGTYISPEFKAQFNAYLRSCGSSARIINGYGLSELGGACSLCPSDWKDDSIGFLLPGFKAKILVEDENRCYDISDGERTGVLLLNSPTMSSGKLDDTVFFELEHIDGEDYFNTNDLMRVNEDGSLTCIGRSNHFFVNNAGVRFDAGLVENAVTAQPGIAACGLAPEFHKILHDNVPVLYVELRDQDANSVSTLRKALIQVFIEDGALADTNLPSQCVITERVPLNPNGKVDAKKLASGSVKGDRYSIQPVRAGSKVIDILLVPALEGEHATMGAGIPEELEGDPYNILTEVFAAMPDLSSGDFSKLLNIPGLRKLVKRLTDFDIDDIPNSMLNSTPQLFTLAINKYVMPLMKGVPKMSKNNFPTPVLLAFQGMAPNLPKMPKMPAMPPVPPVPPVPPMPTLKGKKGKKAKKAKESFGDFNSSFTKYWKQLISAQESAMKEIEKQWEAFFDYNTDMWDAFIDFLPKDMPFLPKDVEAISPRDLAKRAKKFRKMANKHLTEQVESAADFVVKGQKQARDLVSTAMDKVEENLEDKDEKKKAKKKAEKKAAAKKAAKKKAAKKAAEKAAAAEAKVEAPVEEVKVEAPVVEAKVEAPAKKAPAAKRAPAAKKAPEAPAKKAPAPRRAKAVEKPVEAPAEEAKVEAPAQTEANTDAPSVQ